MGHVPTDPPVANDQQSVVGSRRAFLAGAGAAAVAGLATACSGSDVARQAGAETASTGDKHRPKQRTVSSRHCSRQHHSPR